MGLGRKIVLVLCLIVFAGSAGVILDYVLNGIREQSALEQVGDLRSDGREDLVTDKGTVIGKYVDLYLKNKDLIGWVTGIPGLRSWPLPALSSCRLRTSLCTVTT